MDRRGHAMHGMDAVYVHPTAEMRQRLCDVLEQLWRTAVAQRYELAPRSCVPLLDEILIAYEQGQPGGTAPQSAPQDALRPSPGAGKGPLTCGAPLRNRTVDLLLTISRQRGLIGAGTAFDQEYPMGTGTSTLNDSL